MKILLSNSHWNGYLAAKSRSIPQLKELEVLEIRVEMLLVIIVMVL